MKVLKRLLTQQTRDGGRDIIATKFEMGKPVVSILNVKDTEGRIP